MKYICHIASKAESKVPMEVKHNKLIAAMKEVQGVFGIDKHISCPAPDFKGNTTAYFPLRGKMRGVTIGYVHYRLRINLNEDQASDDLLIIEFSSKKVDLKYALQIFRQYVNAFEAYRMYLYPEDLIYEEAKVPFELRKDLNFRFDLQSFYPFQFFDHLLVQRLFKCDLIDLCIKLKNEINHIEIFDNGVFIQGFDKYPTLSETLEYSKKIETFLGIKLPYRSNANL